MTTIELNQPAMIVVFLIVAGIGALLPSATNLSAYLAGMVYMISAVSLWTVYKKKNSMIIKVHH